MHWGPKAKVRRRNAGRSRGMTKVGEREVRCRVVDADANGLFSDQADVLRIDLNGDGNFDLFQEQFRCGRS